jgi:hypothetical protein
MSSTSRRGLVAGALAAVSLSGCYVVPIGSDGMAVYPAAAVPAAVAPAAVYAAPASAFPPSSMPIPSTMNARLYPSNDLAAQTGVLSGTVTNLMTGKGVFQLAYQGELLSGEATRVPGGEPRGVANAYGSHGTFMNCAYRMTTPYQGTGTCKLSNGALYEVHIGG